MTTHENPRYDKWELTEETVMAVAKHFHETYERLAPRYNYVTRPESSVSWSEVPHENKSLMVETVRIVLEGFADDAYDAAADRIQRQAYEDGYKDALENVRSVLDGVLP